MKRKKMINSRIKLGALIAILIMCGAACGDSITLKNAARLATDDGVVHLGDIAALEGAQAEALSEVVIHTLDGTEGTVELTVRDVRRALDDAKVHWGVIELNGRRVIVRPARDAAAGGLVAMQGATIEAGDSPDTIESTADASTIARESTVRGEIASFLVRALRRPAADVRLTFREADATFLDLDRASHRLEIAPQSSLAGDQVTVVVRRWDGARVEQEQRISIRLMLRVPVAVPLRDIDRKESIVATDVSAESRWLPPSQASLAATPADVVGAVANRRLDPGEFVRASAVRGRTLVRKGDLILVRCLVGGSVITLQAEARADGSAGDDIACRKRGERTTFLATITETGDAVIDLGR